VVMAMCVIEVALASIIGVLSSMALGVPRDLRGANMLSIVFGNSSAMPLILFEETASLFPQRDAKDLGTLYVLMYSMINRFLMWTCGLVALEPLEEETEVVKPPGSSLQRPFSTRITSDPSSVCS